MTTTALRHESDHDAALHRFFRDLQERYGPQHWWPADSPWEVAVGAVLTQNTNWGNVEKAITNLKRADVLPPDRILDLPIDALAAHIRPSGYFNLKASRLRNVAAWWQANAERGFDVSEPLAALRRDLLHVKGVGEETADSILLYAFGRPTFVVDAYTRRVLSRHGLVAATATYGEIKALCEAALPPETGSYNEYHALIVRVGKLHCSPTPRCANCPLAWHLSDVVS